MGHDGAAGIVDCAGKCGRLAGILRVQCGQRQDGGERGGRHRQAGGGAQTLAIAGWIEEGADTVFEIGSRGHGQGGGISAGGRNCAGQFHQVLGVGGAAGSSTQHSIVARAFLLPAETGEG